MIVDRLSKEELAKIFAHFLYRNTAVEDYHRENVCMDEKLYAAVLRIVTSNLRKVARNHNLLLSVKEEELASVVNAMYPTRAMEFLHYAQEFAFYCTYKPGFGWDPPVLLQTQPPKDKAVYLLGGEFLRGCTRRWDFDDSAMCRINKDIYNRIYTLVCMGLLPAPAKTPPCSPRT